MQSKNQNDSVQLSTRYQQYNFAKRHIAKQSGGKVFPFRGTDEETTTQLKYVGQVGDADWAKDGKNLSRNAREGYRVYDSSGIAPTVRSQLGGASKGSQIIQINKPTHSNDRVYGTISPTLNTMQGGMRQPFIQNPKMRDYKKKSICGAITATSYKEPQVINSIRRLTPTECARLQGFPDDWHKIEGISDTQAYKCYGNAVTVNVIKDIIKRLT